MVRRECVGRNEKFWHLCAQAAEAGSRMEAAAEDGGRWSVAVAVAVAEKDGTPRFSGPVRRPSMTHCFCLAAE